MSANFERPSVLGITRGTTASTALGERARRVAPGGINSARRTADPWVCIASGSGAYVEDYDGNHFLDFHNAFGAVVLGHRHPHVERRVVETVKTIGELFGVGTTKLEVEVAEKIVGAIPTAEQVLMCNVGSEAVTHAIRLARATTGRNTIVKFEGCYHGHHDPVMVSTLSAFADIGSPKSMSAGVDPAVTKSTLVCRYNDLGSVQRTFAEHGKEIAAVIVEPIAHNAPSILPKGGFLEGLRAICDQHGSLLIFDEVITGFRHDIGGYQRICGVAPDITTLGKAMANGYPVAAVAGRRDLLGAFNTSPTGNVVFAGTHNGGAVSMAATLATLEVMESEPVHEHLARLGARMREGLRSVANELGVPTRVAGFGSIYVMAFSDTEVTSYDDVVHADWEFFRRYRHAITRRGVLAPAANYGRCSINYKSTVDDIDRALEIERDGLKATIREYGLPRLATAQ